MLVGCVGDVVVSFDVSLVFVMFGSEKELLFKFGW